MRRLNDFKIPMRNGNMARYCQEENGMYIGAIKDKDGITISAITALTVNEIHKWIAEHDEVAKEYMED